MIVVGLTGSIAVGKSEASAILRAQDIPVFDADQHVHDLYASAAGAELVKMIAPEALVAGRVNRDVLSRIVLSDPHKLKLLEIAVHADVRASRDAFLAAERHKGSEIAVLDIPLLFESGADADVDVTLVISADADIQRKRALARSGMSEEKLAGILAHQMPDAIKRARADQVIENNGTKDQLRQNLLAFLTKIKSGTS